MIRYPKRNIAQKPEKQLPAIAPPEPLPTPNPTPQYSIVQDLTQIPPINLPTPITSSYLVPPGAEEEIVCENAHWHNILYPAKLWQINNDLDVMAYSMHKLSPEDQQKLMDRIPFSMAHAERQADTLLKNFIRKAVHNMGRDSYVKTLESAATDNSKILFALRCGIASSQAKSDIAVGDAFTIYHNEEMGGGHFYPDECKRTGKDPETGEEFVYYTDTPEKSDKDYGPYWRAENHISPKHTVRQRIKQPALGKMDYMPEEMFGGIKEILLKYNITITCHADAWKSLDEFSKKTSVEDRILARIMYLIANAQHNKT